VQRVTVCGAPVVFFQTTLVERCTISEAGLKQKLFPPGQPDDVIVTTFVGATRGVLATATPPAATRATNTAATRLMINERRMAEHLRSR
jgi:hypothetical protein